MRNSLENGITNLVKHHSRDLILAGACLTAAGAVGQGVIVSSLRDEFATASPERQDELRAQITGDNSVVFVFSAVTVYGGLKAATYKAKGSSDSQSSS